MAAQEHRAVDVFVLTAIEPEYLAVVRHLEPGRTRHSWEGAAYEVGRFGRHTVAVQLTGPGNELAAALGERAIRYLRPDVLLMVGVAGGRKDAALGDVVVADTVYGYESGRDEEDGFRPRVKSWPSSFALVQKARLVAADARWQHRITPRPARLPAAHVGALAAGAKVIAHTRSASGRLLSESAGDTLAVETESLGLLTAARINPAVQALVVRGVSDLLGDKDQAHDAVWQPVAARHAAAFAFELVSVLDVAPRREVVRSRLSVRQLGALAGLLLRVPGLANPVTWQQLLDLLPEVALLISRQPNQHQEALALLQTCESTDSWSRLMDALETLRPDAPSVAALREELIRHQLVSEK
ncbi:hypothetical protein [Streptomyces sp. NPDC050538]|uniref:phosphorylase family protein n=1 Tax=Streptomyces sp. NPDC050538 TaxID=3365627 RepID=UPI00378951B8